MSSQTLEKARERYWKMKIVGQRSGRILLLTVLLFSGAVLQASAYYHPEEGRWLSRDPVQVGPNLYQAMRDDLINRMDALGLVDISVSGPTVASEGSAVDWINDYGASTFGITEASFSGNVNGTVSENGCGCVFTLQNFSVKLQTAYQPESANLWWRSWVEAHEAQHVKIVKAVIQKLGPALSAQKTCEYRRFTWFGLRSPYGHVNAQFCTDKAKELKKQIGRAIQDRLSKWNTLDSRPGYASPLVDVLIGAAQTWVTIQDLNTLGDKTVRRINAGEYKPKDWSCP
jgi:hypothetical protein